jgi:murein DD-endopeptidase MepM/ murein hydrolase activator NlpD
LATDSKITPESNNSSKLSSRTLPSDLWLRLASHGLAIGLVVAAVWLARVDFNKVPAVSLPAVLAITGTAPAPEAAVATPTSQPLALPTAGDQTTAAGDLTRLADVHTIIPSRPRYEIQQYTVQLHDTLFIIADKYNIKPDTVLWGNPVLAGNPNTLSVGQVLNILPVDGALRIVQAGDTLDKIAKVFHSKVEDIINFPGNDIDPTDPQIKNGETVIIPGGWRDVTVWQLPVVSRAGSSSVSGSSGEPGACKGPYSGPTGTFTFIWPANNHYLSGNDYSPTIHPGIDIAAGLGAPIYASDTGVVVFAGLSLYGYGNLVIIDHGNGWQTAYGHLSQINVVCGGAIYQGQVLGLAGSTGNSTGPHLHFEMRSDQYGRVNPWLYLGK